MKMWKTILTLCITIFLLPSSEGPVQLTMICLNVEKLWPPLMIAACRSHTLLKLQANV